MIFQQLWILAAVVPGWIIFSTMIPTNLPGAEPGRDTALAPTNPPIRELSAGVFQIGDVRFDKRRRSVHVPAVVNLREGHIEYILVTTTGKTHESLLRTTAEPMHVQLALLLLGAKGAGTNALPENPSLPLPGEKVTVTIEWIADTHTNRIAAETFVMDRKSGKAASSGPWIFTGSRLREDGFAAQLDGSILSLITDADALLNNPRRRREDDDNWLVRTNGLPPLNATVEIQLRLLP